MAQNFTRRVRKFLTKTNLQESYATIVLVGIIVVVLGLLVANYFTKRNQEIGNGQQTTQTEEEARKAAGEYKVKAGDSLSSIAQKNYGSFDYWPVLARVNKISNPNVIHAESTLQIPSKEEAEEVRVLMTQTTYKVAQGDTLFSISEKVYGNGSKWVVLGRANKVGRLPNGNPLIFADSTLVIPR